MTETIIRVLGDNEWSEYREGRLRALKESPEAFAAKYEDEAQADDKLWVDRLKRSTRLVAERKSGEPVGIASVRRSDTLFDNGAEIFGLWVTKELRGSGIAAALVEAATRVATDKGHAQLVYWVGTENARGVAFASSYGFRPTEHRRPTRVMGSDASMSEEMSAEEIALTLALDR